MKADAAQQRSLLELADIDAELSRLAHRATHLPEQQTYDRVQADHRAAVDRAAILGIGLEDLDAQIAKLESEVDAVRKREDRDRGLLDSGSVTNSRQLEEIQHELGTLERRQSSLEDTLLEVMERRERLAGDQEREQAAVESLGQDLATAGQARDESLAEVERARVERGARRAQVTAALESVLLDLYERQRTASGIGAGRLLGHRCGACRIELDRGELARISSAPEDEVLQCPECRAILLRLTAPA